MKRRYGVYGLQLGLVLAALVVIGMFTTLVGIFAEGYPVDNAASASAADQSGTEWNFFSASGAVLSVLGLAHVVVLPISMYADTGFVRRTTGWRPLRILWVPLSVVPLLQIPVTIVYLLRRTYLLTLRPLLTGRQTGTDSGATTAGNAPRTAADTKSTATDAPRTTARDTVSPSVEEASRSLSQRIISLLERIFNAVFYFLLSYFLGFGVAFGIGEVLRLSDVVWGILGLVLWAGCFWALRRWRR